MMENFIKKMGNLQDFADYFDEDVWDPKAVVVTDDRKGVRFTLKRERNSCIK